MSETPTSSSRRASIIAGMEQAKRGETTPAADVLRSLELETADPMVRNENALNIALEWGTIDGAHHKQWVIDQMVRALTGDSYERMIAPHAEGWDEGTPP